MQRTVDEILALIGDLTDDGEYVDTERLARAVFEADREAGRPAILYQGASPWYGLAEILRDLESRELIDIDPGVAEFTPPESEATRTRVLFVGLTDSGRARVPRSP